MFVTPGYAQEHAPALDEAHTVEDAAHGGGGAFPPFDASTFPSQLLWLAITFGLFYLFLKKVALPRVGGILEVRRDRIAQDLEQAARMKEEADAAVAAYEQELADARANANAIAQQARVAAQADADAERKKIEAALEQKLSEAEAGIASIKSSAMKEVGAIAEETATAIVLQLLGGKVGSCSHRRRRQDRARIGGPYGRDILGDGRSRHFPWGGLLLQGSSDYHKIARRTGEPHPRRTRGGPPPARGGAAASGRIPAQAQGRRKGRGRHRRRRQARSRNARFGGATQNRRLCDTPHRFAEQKIAQAEREAINEVRSSAVDIAVEAARSVLASRVDERTDADLFNASLQDVKTKLN